MSDLEGDLITSESACSKANMVNLIRHLVF